MPEFEETNTTPNPEHNYTPSTDASKKPRGRRRSGGFKTEVASASTGSMGEVSAADALKSEKLSGAARPQQSEERPTRNERPAREERPKREPRAPRERAPRNEDASEETREPRTERAPREPRKERAPREKRAPREPREERITNPQPSEETLASIKSVEAQLAERRAERDARRAEREKNRPDKSERKPDARGKKPQPKGKGKQPQKKGLLAKILGIFGIGDKPEEKKPAGNRNGNRNGIL